MMERLRMPRAWSLRAATGVLGALVLAGTAVGCGDDDSGSRATDPARDGSPTATSSASSASSTAPGPSNGEDTGPAIPPGTPDCAEVWVDGATLPEDYRACVADGALVRPETLGCSSGQALVVHEYRFWAVRGGTIKKADPGVPKDPAYRKDMRNCRG